MQQRVVLLLQGTEKLTSLIICGDSSSTDQSVIDDWKPQTLAPLVPKYEAADVYNLHEPLFSTECCLRRYSVLRMLTLRHRSRAKTESQFCSEQTCGEHKLPLLVVGMTEKLRCFKNACLLHKDNFIYRNKEAWITSIIF